MPLQNRVQPDGAIIAHPARGRFMGNRGILHDGRQRLGHVRWRHKAWVTCLLAFKERRRALMAPGRYTELFFHDEAVAFAAGHRPCGECRRADYTRFRTAAGIEGKIADYDRHLHASRAEPHSFAQKRHDGDIADLPEGVFVLWQDRPHLILRDCLLPFAPEGYGAPLTRPPSQRVRILTPALLVAALRGGYRLTLPELP